MIKLTTRAALGALLLFSLSACNQSPPPPHATAKQISAASQAWQKTADAFVDEYMRTEPWFGRSPAATSSTDSYPMSAATV